ncbi:hypothetical protein D3C84_769080 [compost metagenome]
MRCVTPELGHDAPDPFEGRFGIDHEHRDVHHIVKAAIGRGEYRLQIVECQPNLSLQVGLWRTVFGATNLSRDEQKTIGANRRRIAIALIKCLASGRENHIALCHQYLHQRVGSKR